MKYGIVMFTTDYAIRADDLAKAAEERGFESIFFPEHTHIPISRRTPYRWEVNFPKSIRTYLIHLWR
jgi:alkanesulfonate monooxygenase SsuD/methylene tetrahydromethanopterin reductase-like flavin-dependent oxidoreductase (luciferase family)